MDKGKAVLVRKCITKKPSKLIVTCEEEIYSHFIYTLTDSSRMHTAFTYKKYEFQKHDQVKDVVSLGKCLFWLIID